MPAISDNVNWGKANWPGRFSSCRQGDTSSIFINDYDFIPCSRKACDEQQKRNSGIVFNLKKRSKIRRIYESVVIFYRNIRPLVFMAGNFCPLSGSGKFF
jgi:hypothetical protein